MSLQNGGVGFGGAWGTSFHDVTSPGLSYPGLSTTGNKAQSDPGSGSNFRSLGETFGVEDTTWYFSMIGQKLNADDNTRFFGVALYNSSGETLLVGQSSGSPNWNIARGATIVPSTVSSQVESLIVVRVDSLAGLDDITFWVNPDLSLPESSNTPAGSISLDLDILTTIRLGGGTANATQAASHHIIDEIRFEDVSPFAAGLEGDLDGDGFVGISDLNLVLGNWNLSIPPGDALADPSGDNFVGIEDLNTVLGNWNAGTPPVSGSVVPEPGAVSLLGALGLATLGQRRGARA
ncbi:MAG: hypothetical protein R3C45_22395 [Phycisphaerales bacterium]